MSTMPNGFMPNLVQSLELATLHHFQHISKEDKFRKLVKKPYKRCFKIPSSNFGKKLQMIPRGGRIIQKFSYGFHYRSSFEYHQGLGKYSLEDSCKIFSKTSYKKLLQEFSQAEFISGFQLNDFLRFLPVFLSGFSHELFPGLLPEFVQDLFLRLL